MEPKYNENIICGIKLKNQFTWICAPKDIFLMDLTKFSKNDLKDFIEINPERANFLVLNETNILDFLKENKEFNVAVESLKEKYKLSTSKTDFCTSLLIDFDDKKFYSYYPEPEDFAEFMTDDYEYVYKDFTSMLPNNYKYWILKN